ncbi:MAG: GNAT family N-acetyltransferase [Clostridiales bacterium]|nr:GNAT family N-acetyltransferase [Clostridiales bacterium]
MIKRLNLNDINTVKDLLELQVASYIKEAEIIGFYDIPPLKDTVDSLKESKEIFYGYYVDNVLAGMISYKIYNHILDIHRVAVHPEFFRKGIAQKLIEYVENVDSNVKKIIVCTGKGNIPAEKLYLKNGYIKTGHIKVNEEVYLTSFEKIKQ